MMRRQQGVSQDKSLLYTTERCVINPRIALDLVLKFQRRQTSDLNLHKVEVRGNRERLLDPGPRCCSADRLGHYVQLPRRALGENMKPDPLICRDTGGLYECQEAVSPGIRV